MLNSSRDFKKSAHLPHSKNEHASPLRKGIGKKDTLFPSLNEIHSKFKNNTDYNIFNDTLGINHTSKQNLISRSSIKFAGSEILKTFNFALNPNLHRKKQLQSNINDQANAKKPVNHTLITKNILEFRKKNVLAISNISLQNKPKLKQSRSVCKGTISMLQNTEDTRAALSKKGGDFVQAAKVDVSEKARDKIRIQMISWLLENKKEAINSINENKQIILSWINYVGYIDKNEFDHLLFSIGIKNDRTLNDRLFWLFDLNGNGVIENTEILIAIDMFKEHSIEEKVNVFFNLCDDDGSGFLDEEKLYRFLRKNLKDEDDKSILRAVVKEFAEELNYKNPKAITKYLFSKWHLIDLSKKREDLLRASNINPNIKIVVEKNVKVFKATKKDLKFNSANLISSQFENQSGIYFPYMEKLVKVVEEKEKLIENFAKVKNNFLKVLRFSKEINNTESDSEDPLD